MIVATVLIILLILFLIAFFPSEDSWFGIIIRLLIGIGGFYLILTLNASSCEGEQHKPPYCWQQADGQIFCENQD